jgi:sec-independent protein translocase protein TatA
MFSNALTPGHLLILVLLIVVLFGAKRLPDVARGLGKSARILKAEVNGMQQDDAKRAESKTEDPKALESKSEATPDSSVGETKASKAPSAE